MMVVFAISRATWISKTQCPSLAGHYPLRNVTAFTGEQAVPTSLYPEWEKFTTGKILACTRNLHLFLTNEQKHVTTLQQKI